MAQAFYDEFPDLILKLDDVRTSGTYTVFLWTLEGTHSVPGGTGNRVEVSGWEYWRLTDETCWEPTISEPSALSRSAHGEHPTWIQYRSAQRSDSFSP
ncbi:MAG: hypothetical protein ACI9W2_003682 [Gammaproteobacteria bacterium]|jgi:hypothetical protein